MAKKTAQEIKEIIDVYNDCGTYAETARRLKMASSTVSKYVKEYNSINETIIENDYSNVGDISIDDNLAKWLELSPNELKNLTQLQMEIKFDCF